jgi:hypothetical protein
MILDEAIKINTDELAPMLVGKKIEWQEAFWLGIEALKRLQDMRTSPCTTADEILLGETEE